MKKFSMLFVAAVVAMTAIGCGSGGDNGNEAAAGPSAESVGAKKQVENKGGGVKAPDVKEESAK